MGFIKSFGYAARGVWYCIRHERNFRIHLGIAAYVLAFAPYFSLSRAEWAVLLLTFAAVISAELFNTAVERLCDKVCLKKDELIKLCKDCAAGAVLVCAIFAVIIGIVLFWDVERFALIGEYFLAEPVRFVLLGAAIAAAAVYVFLPERFKNE